MYIKYDKATHLSLAFKFILYVKFSNSLSESDVPLFLEFILFITLLDSYIVIYFFSNAFSTIQRTYDLTNFI